MSLYFEAAKFISGSTKQKGTLKTRVFADKSLKSKPAQIYGLVIEASKYASILKEVIEKAGVLTAEKKLTPELALLLVHDLLFSKRGIAAPQGHKLRVMVEKHKTRLAAELTKYRLRHKFASLEELKASADGAIALPGASGASDGVARRLHHPRWVRINRLKTTLQEQLTSTFSAYEHMEKLDSIVRQDGRTGTRLMLHIDDHVPDLLAIPAGNDLSRSAAYLEGKLILQDKASCFPAYLLNPEREDELFIDGCAAPGNKTTHLASLISQIPDSTRGDGRAIVSCERDKARAQILSKMVNAAGAESMTTIKAGQDFLRAEPDKEPWCNATAILLDPSCSGSGIIGRDEAPERIILPSIPTTASVSSKKRKRGPQQQSNDQPQLEPLGPEAADEEEPGSEISAERLESLGRFQAKLIQHAMSFPNVRKITYSTCSVHEQENEHVVANVLASEVAKRLGWQILRRRDQVDGMKRWHLRGVHTKSSLSSFTTEIADACIRCNKHTPDGTQGFFVAGFVRIPGDSWADDEGAESEEWTGFDDS